MVAKRSAWQTIVSLSLLLAEKVSCSGLDGGHQSLKMDSRSVAFRDYVLDRPYVPQSTVETDFPTPLYR